MRRGITQGKGSIAIERPTKGSVLLMSGMLCTFQTLEQGKGRKRKGKKKSGKNYKVAVFSAMRKRYLL